jgi:hypothetical protein
VPERSTTLPVAVAPCTPSTKATPWRAVSRTVLPTTVMSVAGPFTITPMSWSSIRLLVRAMLSPPTTSMP